MLDQPSVLQGKLSGVGWLDPQKQQLCFNFEQPLPCSPQQLHHFTLPPTVCKGSTFSTPSPAPAVRITFPGEKPRRIFPGSTAEGGAGRVPVLGNLGPGSTRGLWLELLNPTVSLAHCQPPPSKGRVYKTNLFLLECVLKCILLCTLTLFLKTMPSFLNFLNLFIWLHWVFIAKQAFLKLRCTGFSLQWLLFLQSTGSEAQQLQ